MNETKCWKRGDGRRTRNYCYPPTEHNGVAVMADGAQYDMQHNGWRRPMRYKSADGQRVETCTRRQFKRLRIIAKRVRCMQNKAKRDAAGAVSAV